MNLPNFYFKKEKSDILIEKILASIIAPAFAIIKENSIPFTVKQFGYIYLFMTKRRIILFDSLNNTWFKAGRSGEPYSVFSGPDYYAIYYDGGKEGIIVDYLKKTDAHVTVNRNLLFKTPNHIKVIQNTDQYMCLVDSKSNVFFVDKEVNMSVGTDIIALKASAYIFGKKDLKVGSVFAHVSPKRVLSFIGSLPLLGCLKKVPVAALVESGSELYLGVYDPFKSRILYSKIDKTTNYTSTKFFTGEFSIDTTIHNSEELAIILSIFLSDSPLMKLLSGLQSIHLEHFCADASRYILCVKASDGYHTIVISRKDGSILSDFVTKKKFYGRKMITASSGEKVIFDFDTPQYAILDEKCNLIKVLGMKALTPFEQAMILIAEQVEVSISSTVAEPESMISASSSLTPEITEEEEEELAGSSIEDIDVD